MDATEYFKAIREGAVDRVKTLVVTHPELLGSRDRPDYAPGMDTHPTGLHVAVHAGQLAVARCLVGAGIDLEATTSEGRTALHDSIEFGRDAITEMLLEHGAHVDICSAAILGKLDRVRELLDAEPALANDRSTHLSPLGWAAFGNQIETARELLGRGARMDDGEVLCAAAVGHVEVGHFLIERGADPNEVHAEAGANALHAAAAMKYSHDSARFVEMLLEHGADRSIRDSKGRTALDIAEEKARAETAEPRNFDAVIQLLRGGG
jgi:ankyrin repeat protein